MKLDPVHLELFVTSLAKRKVKAAVEAQILAEGKKVAHFSLRELYDKREAYFQSHCEELIALGPRGCLALAFVRPLPKPDNANVGLNNREIA